MASSILVTMNTRRDIKKQVTNEDLAKTMEVIVGNNHQLNEKIDSINYNLSQKIDRVSADIDTLAIATKKGFDEVGRRFEQVDRRFEKVDKHLEKIDGRLDNVEYRLDSIEGRLSNIEDNHGARIQLLEVQMNVVYPK